MRLTLILLLAVASPAHAASDDERPRLDWMPRDDAPRGANSVAMTSAGAIMVPVGFASAGTGLYFLTRNLFACGLYNDSCTPERRAAIDRDSAVGLTSGILGLATAAAGIPLLIVGADRVGRARKRRVAPWGMPLAGGGGVGMTGVF